MARHAWAAGADGVVLALHEALVNAQRHGGGAVRAEASIDSSTLVLRVWDRGPGFDLAPYVHRPPDPLSERGRGLWLISRLATTTEVCYHDDGVALVMRFDRPRLDRARASHRRRTEFETLC